MRLCISLAASALLTATLAARADTFTYNINLNGLKVSFDESSILTSLTRIESSSFLPGSSSSVLYLDINPEIASCPNVSSGGQTGCIDALISPNSVYVEVFMDGPLTTPGVTYSNGANNTVEITETPEPSTLALLGTGLLSLAGISRRCFIKTHGTPVLDRHSIKS